MYKINIIASFLFHDIYSACSHSKHTDPANIDNLLTLIRRVHVKHFHL